MRLLVALLSVMPSGDVGQKIPSGKTVRLPEVSGVIATPVLFQDRVREKIAEAGIALLASCRYAHVPNEGPMPEWGDTLLDTRSKKAYLHIRLAKPRTIKTVAEEKVEVSEMLIVLPLNNGGLWVRSGDRAKGFGKYAGDEMVRLQQLLREAVPAK